MWHGTGIRDYLFLLYIWFDAFFINNVVDYSSYGFDCKLFWGILFFVVLIFLNYCIFVIMCISYYYLCYSTLGFLTWLFCHGISWHIRAYHSNEILVHLKVLCARIPFPCDNIYCKPCKYPCIGNLLKGGFLPILTFWSRLCFCLVIFHQELVMNTLNS